MAATIAAAYSGNPADSSGPGKSTATAVVTCASNSGTTRCAVPSPSSCSRDQYERAHVLLFPLGVDIDT